MQKFIRQYIHQVFICKLLVIGVIATCVLGTFGYINRMYDGVAMEIFLGTTLPGYMPSVTEKTFQKALLYYTTNMDLESPFSLLCNTIPYFKSINKELGLYEDDMEAYFQMDKEEILSLKEGNLYIPKLPTPKKMDVDIDKLQDYRYLLQYFITGDSAEDGLGVDKLLLNQWNFKKLATGKIAFKKEDAKKPKILIFHTHVKERYADEGEWNEGDGVAAVGEKLKQVLEEQYGIQSIHITDSVYLEGKGESVTGAYERIEPIVQKVLKENPSIEMCIDLHRDGIEMPGKLVTTVKGKPTAQVMFVAGMCQIRNQKGELVPMKNLKNPYIKDNLALALQAQIEGYEYYPGFLRKIYFKPYRYTLHMKPLSLLLEVGMQNNTKEEAVNTAEPIAHILAKVLEKD